MRVASDWKISRRTNGSAPTWSSWPWVRTMAWMSTARSRRYEKSGSTRSMPSISLVGNMSPVSTTTSSSPYSTTVMFLPISPKPPSGRMRTAVTRRFPADSCVALAGAARDQEPVLLQRRLDRRSLVLARRHHRQSHVVLDDAQHLKRRLHGDRTRRHDRGVIDRHERLVDLARPLQVPGGRRVVERPHLRPHQVGADEDAAGPADLKTPQEDPVVAGQHVEPVDR